jgi:hypothetical protein
MGVKLPEEAKGPAELLGDELGYATNKRGLPSSFVPDLKVGDVERSAAPGDTKQRYPFPLVVVPDDRGLSARADVEELGAFVCFDKVSQDGISVTFGAQAARW